MATINLLLRTKKNPANINVRFTNGRAMDFFATTNIFINPIHWDKERQKIRNLLEIPNKDILNSKLSSLKTFIIDQYNIDFSNGEIIDKKWLENTTNKHFNRPKNEVKKVNLAHNIYYSDYTRFWLDNKAKKWKTAKNKYLDDTAISQYESFLKIFLSFEKTLQNKVKFKSLDSDLINDFVTYMEEVESYEQSTVKRHVGRLRFFCNRAVSDNLEVNKNFKEQVFITEREEVLEPYLNEEEIERVFKKDLSFDKELDDIRDNFIIGLWTGLRISDFNNKLNVSNIQNDFIEIQTTKTGTWTTIPVHPMIKSILDKRFGLLPPKVKDYEFNLQIKNICQIVDIDQEIKGKLFDAKKKRNVVGVYKKYLLVSSHICRRSFATNLYGLVPNNVIMVVGGWATEKMMLHYIKKSKKEHAEVLRDTWKKKYESK